MDGCLLGCEVGCLEGWPNVNNDNAHRIEVTSNRIINDGLHKKI